MNSPLPVITWGNGTVCPTQLYSNLLKHLASHGYIVVATNNTMNKTGQDMLNGISAITSLNSDSTSIFYHKIDTSNIGASGHSQGGGGAINCGKDSRIKCLAGIAPIYIDPSNVQCPMLIISGEKDFVVLPEILVKPIYKKSKVPTIYGCLKEKLHTSCMTSPEDYQGYITAWFDYFLKGDEQAKCYFVGYNYLLQNDDDWKDICSKNLE